MALEPHTFNSNEIWTLAIAAYAALVSTFVLGWDAYKWLASGPRIDLSASMNMKQVGGGAVDPRTYISVTAYNVGDQPTTITNLGGLFFKSWWGAHFRRRKIDFAFVVPYPQPAQPLPYRFEIGARWLGLMEQTGDMEAMARDGYLFMVLYTAHGGRGTRVRVRWQEKKAAAPDTDREQEAV
jgi:hypothetical protein